jgi:hypothetical protein
MLLHLYLLIRIYKKFLKERPGKVAGGKTCSMSIAIQIQFERQPVQLKMPAPKLPAATWSKGGVGLVPPLLMHTLNTTNHNRGQYV